MQAKQGALLWVGYYNTHFSPKSTQFLFTLLMSVPWFYVSYIKFLISYVHLCFLKKFKYGGGKQCLRQLQTMKICPALLKLHQVTIYKIYIGQVITCLPELKMVDKRNQRYLYDEFYFALGHIVERRDSLLYLRK